MTGDAYVTRCMETLRSLHDRAQRPEEKAALEFALLNLRVEPMTVGGYRLVRRLSDVVFNLLGTRDADEVERWISNARCEIALSRVDPDKS